MFFPPNDITQIVLHKADEPDPVFDFLDADRLAGERGAEIDLFAVEAEAAAAGDIDGAVVEGIVRLGNALIDPRRSGIEL